MLFCRKSLANTVVYGLTYAFSQCVIYLMYAVVFRFGAFQVTLDPSNVAHVEFEAIFVAFTSLIFGAVGAGQAGAFAPNYAKAKLSANRIFFLLDRMPLIDGYSEDGVRPVSTVIWKCASNTDDLWQKLACYIAVSLPIGGSIMLAHCICHSFL